jgi:D-hydroxyproline dehydrogenase
MSRIIIVGGGIIGLCCGIDLQRRGHQVDLLECEASDQASSWGNAGHIAIEQVEPLASRAAVASLPKRLFSRGGAASFPIGHLPSWLPFGLRLLAATAPARFRRGRAALEDMCGAAMPEWRECVDRIGRPELLIQNGHFVFWESDASARAGFDAWASKPTGLASIRPATRDELGRIQSLIWPKLAGGARFEGSGSIADLVALRSSLRACFDRLGGTSRKEAVRRLSDLTADTIVVAAGVGSAALMRQLGHRVPLIAERGYHLEARVTDWPVGIPPVVLEDRSLILTRFEAGLRAASFVEFGRDQAGPDRRKWTKLRRHVNELGIRFDDVTEWMGARPTFPDYLPAIGRSNREPRVVYAFGHQHLGLTLGPLTAKLVSGLVDGGDPPVDVAPFSLARFG